jgi:hypothetical protein
MERPVGREQARALIQSLYAGSPNMVGLPHTAYRALNAVSEYADHARPIRVADPDLVPARRFSSIVDGPAAVMKADALRLLREEFEV